MVESRLRHGGSQVDGPLCLGGPVCANVRADVGVVKSNLDNFRAPVRRDHTDKYRRPASLRCECQELRFFSASSRDIVPPWAGGDSGHMVDFPVVPREKPHRLVALSRGVQHIGCKLGCGVRREGRLPLLPDLPISIYVFSTIDRQLPIGYANSPECEIAAG